MLLEGKRILITGAARGIGLAAAHGCLAQGGEVLVTDVDKTALAGAVESLVAEGFSPRQAVLDVTKRAAIAKALTAIADWNALDVLINNAAILDISHAARVTDARWNQVLDINLSGALRVTQAALSLLKNAPSPSVINTISTQAFQGVPESAAYATAKGGLMMLTRSMAVDFGADNIRVNAVAPGFIDTRMALMEDGTHEHDVPAFREHYIEGGRIPLRRPGTPEDCAGAFVFLASNLSLYITGQAIAVDGGLTATY
ncbi:MAG: SDR family NAD(P)-dependent oxidoreductase [Geminicoccaceae bacterium]